MKIIGYNSAEKKSKIISLAFVIVSLALFSVFSSAHAQENSGQRGVSISPLTFELTANPGDVVSNKIKIYNPTTNATGISMKAEDIEPVGEAGYVVTVSESEERSYSVQKWIEMNPDEFTLEPNESKFVEFTITVPLDAEPGGKYGSILASVKSSAQNGDRSGTTVVHEAGALVLLSIPGDVKEEVYIESFKAPYFQEYGPVQFEIKFKNNGTVHAKPKGFVTITDWQGNKVADIDFTWKNVMPDAVRINEAKWDKKWIFGKFNAVIVGVYGASNKPISSNVVTFWVFPWKLISGIMIVIAVVLFILYKTKRRWKMAAKILLKGEHNS